jgi:hypothetical protein
VVLTRADAIALDDSRKFYEQEFEARFLEETKAYYVNESTNFLSSNSISDYMTKVTRLQRTIVSCVSCVSCVVCRVSCVVCRV